MSGPIGLSEFEEGTRGLWLEKRLALIRTLKERGHSVDIYNRTTKYTDLIPPPDFDGKHDLLFIEFGSSNTRFYGKDLEETARLIRLHRSKVVFLCDDPDLPYLWKSLDTKTASRWSTWMNAKHPQAFGGQPEGVSSFDAPFAALLTPQEPLPHPTSSLVYIGRPKGREKVFRALAEAKVPLRVHGRPKEWTEFQFPVLDSPTQAERRGYYAKQLACLVIADKKHKRLGWRTGRAYHALYAGCPALVEGNHEALAQDFDAFDSPEEIAPWLLEVARSRKKVWDRQMKRVASDRAIFDQTFREFGL